MIKKKNRGFTLMEMLIVVAIIAVLVAVAIPVLNNNLEKARQAVDMANARAIQAILATLVNTGEVVFPEKTNDTYAEGIGIWVLVVRDLSKIPQGYNKKMHLLEMYTAVPKKGCLSTASQRSSIGRILKFKKPLLLWAAFPAEAIAGEEKRAGTGML